MKLKDYLYSKAIGICIGTIGLILLGIYMCLVGADFDMVVLGMIFYSLIGFLFLITGYLIARKRIIRIRQRVEQLDKKYLAAEVVAKPYGAIEQEYYFLMKEISKSAIETIEKTERERDDYYDYIENWIHEMKTPLTACSLILDNDCDRRKLKKELNRANDLMDTVLFYARLRTIDRDIKVQKVDIVNVINEAVKTEMNLLIAAKVSINIEGESSCNTDAKILDFIIKQFLVNTSKYCPGSKISIKVSNNTIIYEDNGIGIPSYDLQRISERGFTGTNGRKLGSSTGMGLYIVGKLCDSMGIAWTTESEEGQFTRHTLILGGQR